MSVVPKKKRTYWDLPDALSKAALAKRRVAASLRELIALAVTSDAPEDVLIAVSESIDGIVARLSGHPARTFRDAFESCKTDADFAPFADRSLLTGQSHPFAPPMKLSMQGEVAVGQVRFGRAFEGVPGHVHGGMVAAALDETLGFLAVNNDIGGVTAVLTVRYRSPTPMETDLSIEAKVVRKDGRKAFVEGKMMAGDVVCAEAEGVLVAIDRERMLAVIDSAKKGQTQG